MAEKKYHLCSSCTHSKESGINKAYYCNNCLNGYHYNKVSNTSAFTKEMDKIINPNKRLVVDINNGYFYIDSGLCTTIEKVIFNPPATIVYWTDNTKTVVRTQNDELFDPEKGLAMAVMKKSFGNKGSYYNEVKKWVEPYYKEHALYVKTEEEILYADDKEIARIKAEISELSAQIAYDEAIAAIHDYAHRKRGLTND